MGTIHLVTTHQTFSIPTKSAETLLEVLRRSNIPLQGILLLNKEMNFVSLTEELSDSDEVWAYSLRNVDFTYILPHYDFVPTVDPVTELIQPLQSPSNLGLVQYSRTEAFDYIYESVNEVLSSYLGHKTEERDEVTLQVALSPGGDGRVLAECIRRFWDNNPNVSFHSVIVAVGFEEEHEHISNAIKIADQFRLPYSVFTYWVQQLNFAVARETGRHGIILGYNQEDVIADRLYQLVSGKVLENFPVRQLEDFDIIAPLFQIPKKMLDAMDLRNSMRNYNMRSPSISYLRSSLYLLSYIIVEQFPSIANVMSGRTLTADDADKILHWLETQ